MILTQGGDLVGIKHLRLGLEANRAGQCGSLEETRSLGTLEAELCVQFCWTVSLCHGSDGLCRNCWLEWCVLSHILVVLGGFDPPS